MIDLSLFIEKNRIYLSQEVCELLKAFVEIMSKNAIPVGVYGSIPNPTLQTLQKMDDACLKAYEALRTELPPARAALEREFRKLLGVEANTVP